MNNKEDILRKARATQKDERTEQINVKGFKIAWYSVTAMLLILLAFRWYNNESSADLIMISMAQNAAHSFYIYYHMRDNKTYLIGGIMSIVAILLGFAALLTQYGVY